IFSLTPDPYQSRTTPTSDVSLPLKKVGSSSFSSAPMATNLTGGVDEFDSAVTGNDADGGDGEDQESGVNRTLPGAHTGNGKAVSSSARAKSNPGASTIHFQGLNFHDQRFANGGNQFSVEPPDQALCAGNGFVLESVNDVLQVY